MSSARRRWESRRSARPRGPSLDKDDHAACWQFIVDHMARADCPGHPAAEACPEIAMVHTIMEPFRPLPEQFVGHHTVSVVSMPEKPRKTMAEILDALPVEPVDLREMTLAKVDLALSGFASPRHYHLPVEILGPQYEHTDINRLTTPELP